MLTKRYGWALGWMSAWAATGLVGCGLAPIVPGDIFEGLDEEALRNAEPPTYSFNGEWLSEQYAYAIEIENRIGTVTLPNSEVADVGDVLLVITEVRDGRFSGRHLFRDGTVQDVVGVLLDGNTLVVTGGDLSWRLTRIGPGINPPIEDIFEGIDEDDLANAEPTFVFDGNWLNEEFSYSMRVDNRIGVATLVNTNLVEAGDVILLILDIEDEQFSGRHLFPDGSVREVMGSLPDQRTLVIVGGGVTLRFTKTSPLNTAPLVDAGRDIDITLSTPTVLLVGEFADDGLPIDETSALWRVTEGPAGAVIADPTSLSTEVTFPGAGRYVLTLEVTDQQLAGSDSVIVVVDEP